MELSIVAQASEKLFAFLKELGYSDGALVTYRRISKNFQAFCLMSQCQDASFDGCADMFIEEYLSKHEVASSNGKKRLHEVLRYFNMLRDLEVNGVILNHRLRRRTIAKEYNDAKRCVIGSSAFNPTRRPWIDLSKEPTSEVWQAISECPSGALTCVYTHGTTITLDNENNRSLVFDGVRQIGECDWQVTDCGWIIYHTEVSPDYGGKGIAKRLVYKVIEAAEQSKQIVTATCSYAVKILDE